MRMFADDTKLWTCIRSEADSVSLQKDLDRPVEWLNELHLGFNPKKCKVMHIGQPLQNVTKYFMSEGSTKVEVQGVDVEKT